MDYISFQSLIDQKRDELFRPMQWREDTRPYYVLVSELMLQQTQVVRVTPKFEIFIERFPDVNTLASADLADVLVLWQGLGYNRRAKFLHEAAKMIVHEFSGEFPSDYIGLQRLPGVGINTAGAIAVYSYNQPVLFIETNIRTVYIHHFFNNQFNIDDKQILDILGETIDRYNPREFYWALMDYGSYLKASGVRNVSNSKQYKKQSALKGSLRETRGSILRVLSSGEQAVTDLRSYVDMDDRFERALQGLLRDGLIQQTKNKVNLTK